MDHSVCIRLPLSGLRGLHRLLSSAAEFFNSVCGICWSLGLFLG